MFKISHYFSLLKYKVRYFQSCMSAFINKTARFTILDQWTSGPFLTASQSIIVYLFMFIVQFFADLIQQDWSIRY